MNYKYLLFDLDGTLTDSAEGITKSAQYALHKLGIEENDLNKLRPFIGPPLTESFMRFYELTKEEADQAVVFYRERFSRIGIFENAVLPGVPQMLDRMKALGKVMVIASSKPEVFVERIMERYDLQQYFAHTVGATLDGQIGTKEAVIREAFRRLELTEAQKKETLMIGDRLHDVEGARQCGIACLGAYVGFAEPGELEKAGADYVVHSIREMEEMLAGELSEEESR